MILILTVIEFHKNYTSLTLELIDLAFHKILTHCFYSNPKSDRLLVPTLRRRVTRERHWRHSHAGAWER